jgi:hypothetical protein
MLAAHFVSDATGAAVPVSELVAAYEEVERRNRFWRWIERTTTAAFVVLLFGLLVWTAHGLLTEQRCQRLACWEHEATLLSASPGLGLLEALAYVSSAVHDGDEPCLPYRLFTTFFRG